MDCYDECLSLSNKIISKYIELLVFPVYDLDLDMRNEMVDSILDMVLEEYKLIHKIIELGIDKQIDRIYSGQDDERNEAIVRIKNKLTDRSEILNGVYITADELGLYNLDKNLKFSIYDTIVSMFNIDTIKILKEKIYSLNSDCLSDDKFIELLKTRLNVSKIELLFNTNVSEIIALNYNTSIDDIPRIDVNKIRNKIKLLNNEKYDNLIEYTVIVFIARIIQELAKIRNVKNNDRDVFKYLVFITQIEVLINYLDKNKLQELYDFCVKMTNNENKASMNNIKRLVKNKIDN